MSIRNFGNNDPSISRGWTGMQQVLGRGGEARLKVRKEGGGNKSRRARAGEATNLTRKRSFNEPRKCSLTLRNS